MTKTTMKAAAFKEKGGKLEIVEMEIPEVKKGWVRIKVISCGVCRSDFFTKEGTFGNTYPRVPGHEVVGTVDKCGDGVDEFKIGQMVGVGWFGGNHCGKCEDCKEDDWIHCSKELTCGVDYDGGYAEYMIAPWDALAIVPDGIDPVKCSPLLCAGLTVFNSFRNQHIKAGSLVGVQGIGGLGSLGIQFCKKMGYEVIAYSHGNKKQELTKKLGATHYVDTSKDGYINEVKSIGSVKCILVTAPSPSSINGLVDSLGNNGRLVVLSGLQEPVDLNLVPMVLQSKSIVGYLCGDSRQSTETLHFAKINDIEPMCQIFNLDDANDALEKINEARFRHVLKMQ